MSPWILVCSSLFAILGDETAPAPTPALAAYEEAAAKVRAGRDAAAHVDLALWCEAHGLGAERLKHLALAVLIDPKNARARGLLGLVAFRGKWEDPEKVGARVKADEALTAKLAEYNGRRAALEESLEGPAKGRGRRRSRPEAARAHVKLGMWCEQNGLKAEATAHFTSAVVLDPYHDATWKHLGYVKHDGRWMSREQSAAAQRDAEAQHRANQYWGPRLRRWRSGLAEEGKRDEARRSLGDIADPRAVPSIVRTFRDGDEADQVLAVQLFGQVDAPSATRELAMLAIASPWPLVRSTATDTLKGREPRDFAGGLVDLIQARIQYRVEPVRGPGAPGALLVETPRVRMLRTYDAPPAGRIQDFFSGYIGYDSNGLPVMANSGEVRRMSRENPDLQARDLALLESRTAQLITAAQLKAASSQQRLIADVNEIETANAQATLINPRIATVLQETANAPGDLKDDADSWRTWWYDRLGYSYTPPTQVTLAVNASPQPPPPSFHTACFVAGTPVRTIDGQRPIEGLRVGDQVLSQDTVTGALSFRPVLVVYHNPPSPTREVTFEDGETIIASIYHRFWRAGLGWAMARDLKAGETLRTLHGLAKVTSVTPGARQPVFNLDVAQDRTYFVGHDDALVHDNTLPDPHLRPFDAEPTLAVAEPATPDPSPAPVRSSKGPAGQ